MFHAITDAHVQRWLRRVVPDAAHLQVLQRLPLRSFQQHLETVTVTGADDTQGEQTDRFVVRVYRGFLCWWVLDAPDLPQRELAAWAFADRCGLPVPRPFHVITDNDVSVAILGHLPGTPVSDNLTDRVVTELAETLTRLHRAPVDSETVAALPNVSTAVLLDRFKAWADQAHAPELRSHVDALVERCRDLDERPGVVLHGDCHPGNFLADGPRVTGMLDWEAAAIGDPRLDVATLATALRRAGPPTLADCFLQAYDARNEVPLGPLPIWHELLTLRDHAIGAWLRYRLSHDLPVPRTNYRSWIRYLRLSD